MPDNERYVDEEDGDRLKEDRQSFDAALDISRSGGDPRPEAPGDSVTADRKPGRVTAQADDDEGVEVATETQEPAADTTEEAAETAEAPVAEGEGTAAPAEEEITYTLPGGIKVTASELFKDRERMKNLVTQANQMTHYQKLADDRKRAIDESAQREKSVYEQWVEMQIHNQMMAAQQAQQVQAPVRMRPPAPQIKSAFEPYLQDLVKQGRISEDHMAEDSGLIAEYLYDQMSLREALENQLSTYEQRINMLETQLAPVQSTVRAAQVLSDERTIQQEVASTPGYEDFADPRKWEQLKAFVGQQIAEQGTDEYGAPNLKVRFTPDHMRAWADAMMAPAMRAVLANRKQDAKTRQQRETKQAAGEASGTGRQPKAKPKSAQTPEELAMDFSGQSVRKATG